MENTKIEFKGTKGDWIVNKGNNVVSKHNLPIAIVYDGYTAHGSFKNENENDRKLNAKLIANAPAMFEMLKKAKARICSLKLSLLVHPDHESGSEFDDQTESSQELEDEIETLLINATKIN